MSSSTKLPQAPTTTPPHSLHSMSSTSNKRRKLSVSLSSLIRDVSPPSSSSHHLRTPAPEVPDSLHGYYKAADRPGQAPDFEDPEVIVISSDAEPEEVKEQVKKQRRNVTGEGTRADGMPATAVTDMSSTSGKRLEQKKSKIIPSPFHLTKIADLPSSENHDTISLDDILGDVMLEEVWIFNYMHDIPWVMSKFDPDIVDNVKVTFVHGNWKREDEARMRYEVSGMKAFKAEGIC